MKTFKVRVYYTIGGSFDTFIQAEDEDQLEEEIDNVVLPEDIVFEDVEYDEIEILEEVDEDGNIVE